MDLLTNPVLISVLVMSILCLCKINIMIAILISAVLAGLIAGMPMMNIEAVAGQVLEGGLVADGGELVRRGIIPVLLSGMGGNTETALSYVLLGALAYGIQQTGLANILSEKIQKAFGKSRILFILVITLIACLSQNLVPIHIAFIPILIPSLLHMMNEMKIDRRAIACSLTFGLKAPYIAIPAGFGLIFHGVIATAMNDNLKPYNVPNVQSGDLYKYLYFPVLGMMVGFLIAILISFRKPREYQNLPVMGAVEDDSIKRDANGKIIITRGHIGAGLGAVAAFAVQIITKSMPLGALAGVVMMIATGAIPIKKLDETIEGGIGLMGFIAFVMLVAAGYGQVLRETGGVEGLVEACLAIFGDNKLLAVIIMLLLGLIITMGIGTSFGTIPIVATIYVPLCMALGISIPGIAIIIGTAGALGDAGSPASDSTLGPTSGLNADGQHDHIWDTCVPTFLHYNISLMIFGTIGALIF